MKKQYKSLYPKNVEVEDKCIINYCSIRCTMEVLGGKWKLLIVTSVFKKSMHFSDVKKTIPEISDKMLNDSLKELELHDIIKREIDTENASKSMYQLTSYGLSTKPLVDVLYAWGENYMPQYPERVFV